MKKAYWYSFFTALGVVIIGLLIAVLVLVLRKDDSPNIATTVRFNNGIEFPIVGLGTAYMSSDEARLSVMDAIDRGYRHVDTAYIYGTEVGVGQGISAKIAEGVITRADMFVTSKLWKTFLDPRLVQDAVTETLAKLNFSYIDLYIIHWPMSSPETTDFNLIDTWRALEDLVDKGLIKSIGVSNFNATQIDLIIDNARIKPVNNQIEVHPHCLNKRLIQHCHSRDVIVTAYSPLGAPAHPIFSPESRRVINEPEIWNVAQRHQKTPAQVMIRYQLQHGNIAVPKTVTRDRIITNFDVFDFMLSDADVREIESINYEFRTSSEEDDVGHHQYPFGSLDCL